MTLDLDKLISDLEEFSVIMNRLGIPCRVTFVVPAAPGPVQVPHQDHTIKMEVKEVTQEKKTQWVPNVAERSPAPSPGLKNKKRVKPGKLIKCLFCERSMDRRSLHQHIRKGHQDKYDKEAVTQYIRGESEIAIQGIDQDLLQAVPDARPRTRGDPKELAPGPAPGPAAEIISKMHVKTIKQYKGIPTGMIGVVRERFKNFAEVNFGKSGYCMMPVGSLEAV